MLPADAYRWQHVHRVFSELATRYGYGEVRTPAFEETELFVRTSGETSEVVNKQMYTFLDKGDRNLSLKPEGTAPAIRAYLEHGLGAPGQTTRLWYFTAFFRYERPGKGRYRQAHQFGLELVGSPSPEADAEIIEMTVDLYRSVGIDTRVNVNSLGRAETRARYREALLSYAEAYLRDQSEEVRKRATLNPLRLLDSKDPEVIAAMAGAPKVLDFLESDSRRHFDQLLCLLEEARVPFEVAPNIVRGLDYYTDTVFEITTDLLGSSNDALCGGGRYDNLVADLGGPPTPSVGVGIGVERLLIVMSELGIEPDRPRLDAMAIAATDEARPEVRAIARELRAAGFSVVTDLDGRSLRSQLKRADQLGAGRAVIVGEDELAAGLVSLRDLAKGDQVSVPRAKLIEALRGA